MRLHTHHCKLKFPNGNKGKKTFASQKKQRENVED